MTPLAWMLINARTGKADTTKAYVREEAAKAGAKTLSGHYRSFVAAPVFLYPVEVSIVLEWLDERGRNSTSYGSHADAYEIAARKLRAALDATTLLATRDVPQAISRAEPSQPVAKLEGK